MLPITMNTTTQMCQVEMDKQGSNLLARIGVQQLLLTSLRRDEKKERSIWITENQIIHIQIETVLNLYKLHLINKLCIFFDF